MLSWLVTVRFPLMPKKGTKSVGTELTDTRHHSVEQRSVADKFTAARTTTYRVIVGIFRTGVAAGSHWRTLVDPWPTEAIPIGTW